VRHLMRDEPTGSRRGRLFIVVNDFKESGAFPGASNPGGDLLGRLQTAVREIVTRVSGSGLDGWLGHAIAAALSLGLGAWVFSALTRPYRRTSPGFARPVPLVAQGGAAGRAAVLSASSTPSALAMLELKSALEEGLAHELGLSGGSSLSAGSSSTNLLEAVRAQGALDERSQWALKGILLEMANVETLVVAGQAASVRRSDVSRAARTVFGLLKAAHERLTSRVTA